MRIQTPVLLTIVLAASACADDFRVSSIEAPAGNGNAAAATAASGRVIRVPDDHATIQLAVSAAGTGDLVLVSPGVYEETISVGTPSLMIRGTDRNAVIVDGGATREVGFDVIADGVAIENLSVRNHTRAGIHWRGVTGFRARFVTAYNNADHGIAVVGSRDGLIEDAYASGSAEAGIAIGRCDGCDIAVQRVSALHNAIGFLAVNVVGPLEVRGSTWRHNRAGAVIARDRAATPGGPSGVSIVDNLIDGNASRIAPYSLPAGLAWGNGVAVMGGADNVIEGNHITAQSGNGVLVVPSAQQPFGGAATGNLITDNVIAQSGRSDVSVGGPSASANCVEAQVEGTRYAPRSLGCRDGSGVGAQTDLVPWIANVFRGALLARGTSPSWQEQPTPPLEPTMPDPDTPAAPAVDVYAAYLAARTASALPAMADSMSRAALADGGLPVHTWATGVTIGELQARLPFTLPRLSVALLLLVAGLVAIRATANRARRLAWGAWAIAFVAVGAWVGLAGAAAFALSQM